MARVKDMTSGKPLSLIVAFAIPLLIGNVCQQLYSIVDTAVVGKVLGVNALAAVGAAGWLDWLVLGFMLGLTSGFSIMIAQRFGAGDMPGLRKAVAMSALLSTGTVLIVMIASVALSGPVLKLMNTPEEALSLSTAYIRILFLGLPVSLCYNLFSAILRALGNSRMPLIAMLIASAVNIVLDILFVAVFGWGVQGAAGATITGQACAALFCLIPLSRIDIIRPRREDWQPNADMIQQMLKLSLPIAGSNTIVAVGGVGLQSIINTFGVNFVAGGSAAAKIQGLMEMAGISFGNAMTTYAGQNLGAGKTDRIRSGVRTALITTILLAIVCGSLGILFGRPLTLLFISSDTAALEEVITSSMMFLYPYCILLFLLFSLFILRCTLQGIGDIAFPLASSVLQVFMRIVIGSLLAKVYGAFGACLADVFAWSSAAIMLFFAYRMRINQLDPAGKTRLI